MQFIRCRLGFHKWIGLGRLSGGFTISDIGDTIYANGCKYCGAVKLLYIRHSCIPKEEVKSDGN